MTSEMPEHIRKLISSIGHSFNPDVLEKTRALYAPLIRPVPNIKVMHDLKYGDHKRHQLDIYAQAGMQNAPVLVYIPGGGFVGGDKRSDENFYANVGSWFAGHGVLTVIANYRLAPEFPYPAGGEDVSAALTWVHKNISRFGGDPQRIFLFGQSAGAAHVATCLFDPVVLNFHKEPAGAILASGIYEMTTEQKAPNMLGYYGLNPEHYERMSQITHIGNSKVPLLLSLAEFDPVFLATPTLQLAHAITLRDGKSPRLYWQKNHNHVSTVLSFNTGDDIFGMMILEFIQQVTIS